jgi:hypothetical protein
MSSKPHLDPFLEAALDYAARLKWPVLPLKEGSKKPQTSHSFLDASREEGQKRDWWAKWPQARLTFGRVQRTTPSVDQHESSREK